MKPKKKSTWLLQIKKDIRYLKYPIALWFAILLVYYVLFTLPTTMEQSPGRISLFIFVIFAIFIKQGLTVILVPVAVQSDPVVGSSAPWLTRPISRLKLFSAKMTLLLGLFLVLPLLGEFLRLWFSGLNMMYMPYALLEKAVEQLVFILPLILLAVLTRNITRYFLAAALPLLLLLLIYFSSQFREYLYGSLDANLPASKLLVIKLFIILVAAIAILYQYHSRKTIHTAIIALLGIILLPTVWNMQEWNFGPPPHRCLY
ncbi:MAG: hypothetical protein GY757_08580 [bacterium]|nr:hypothetical protein [bacterium]